MRSLIIAAVIATLPTLAQADTRHPKSLLALTPERVRTATTVIDDPLEFDATFSTEKAHREGWLLLKPDGHDNHLRAIVDKRSGQTRYEIRTKLRYWGTQRDYKSAHFATDGGVQKADLTLTRHGQEFCSTNDLNFACPLTKTIAFEVDESVIRSIAAKYQASGQQPWGFKLKDDTGYDVTSAIVPAEAAGLLQAVDNYRTQINNRQQMAAQVS
jgi:hypothetical protein